MGPIIIIMGAALRPDGSTSPALMRRTNRAAALWHAEGGHIIATGGIVRHPPSEASAMRGLLLAAGVPDASIHLEEKATNTLENALYVRILLDDLDVTDEARQIMVVTDGYHRLRSWMVFAHLGLRVRTVSAASAVPAPRRAVTLRLWARELIALPVYAIKLACARR